MEIYFHSVHCVLLAFCQTIRMLFRLKNEFKQICRKCVYLFIHEVSNGFKAPFIGSNVGYFTFFDGVECERSIHNISD